MKSRSQFLREVIHLKGFALLKLENCASISLVLYYKKPIKVLKNLCRTVQTHYRVANGRVTFTITILARQPSIFLAMRSEAVIIEL